MKTLRITSFILMGLGVLLFSTGILFKIQHWPDMFAGFISGPIVAVTGVLIFILSLFKNRKKQRLDVTRTIK
jgi:membrane protein CcdC involved in cytochrome C biogenesis